MQYHIMPVTMFNQNCSLVWCEQTGEAALVDPGGEPHLVCQQVNSFGVTVKQILLTHGHLDHVGAAEELALYYSVPIIGPHQNDKLLLENLPGQCQMFNMKCIPPILPNSWLLDGEKINVGNETFKVLHCPGHSPGHVVFWNKIRKFILIGDVLFKGSIGRTDLPGGNKATLMHSIHHRIMLLEHDITFLPGHGPISTLAYEQHTNPFL